MNKDQVNDARRHCAAMISDLNWASDKARMIDCAHAGSLLNELKEVEMALEFAMGRIKTLRIIAQGHNITMPKGS